MMVHSYIHSSSKRYYLTHLSTHIYIHSTSKSQREGQCLDTSTVLLVTFDADFPTWDDNRQQHLHQRADSRIIFATVDHGPLDARIAARRQFLPS